LLLELFCMLDHLVGLLDRVFNSQVTGAKPLQVHDHLVGLLDRVFNSQVTGAKPLQVHAFGADLATRFYKMVAIEGDMPKGGRNTVLIAVASIPALLAMKGYALDGRTKQKDAYDVYYSIRNFPGGIDALVGECKPLLDYESGLTGFKHIAAKFKEVDDFGPTCVRNFVGESDILGDRSLDEWQQDAFGQVDAWVQAMGLR
ncbi:MAG: hypothetical protein ABL931_00495, partial [Usitatibacteraceae bacterium]